MAKDNTKFPVSHFDYEHNIFKNSSGFTRQTLLDRFERNRAVASALTPDPCSLVPFLP